MNSFFTSRIIMTCIDLIGVQISCESEYGIPITDSESMGNTKDRPISPVHICHQYIFTVRNFITPLAFIKSLFSSHALSTLYIYRTSVCYTSLLSFNYSLMYVTIFQFLTASNIFPSFPFLYFSLYYSAYPFLTISVICHLSTQTS